MDIVTEAVQLKWEEDSNIIVGQSHFIKTVEDIPEILISSVPGIEYGLAFCEASGPCLIRTEGNNTSLIAEASACAKAVAAGHTFFLIIKNAYPINVLNQIKNCQEVVSIYAATANPLQIIVAETKQGRGIVGVVDGFSPKGVENEEDKADRKKLLRNIGYKIK
ncbi:MAG: adenosine-specific kinase [Spirochaetaceae bacterium]|nr:adenosine-specific kinase [Spirochaetaceae bacterium]